MIDRFRWPHEFLSNFYQWHVTYEGWDYRTSEHAYQAAKSERLSDRVIIQACDTPGQAKKYGKTVRLRSGWEDLKIPVTATILRDKFKRGSYTGFLLLSTDNEYLVEGNNWHDTFWGICDGRGQNHLGKLLMQIREELRRPT